MSGINYFNGDFLVRLLYDQDNILLNCMLTVTINNSLSMRVCRDTYHILKEVPIYFRPIKSKF